ncbi:hypothetical protein ACO2Q2_16565 [Dyella sp. KRB-257]|uniref:hypothetical protein n=1 Tax=Dyella sp. KRB-257 TaxID=3400915 RepID=UPI003C0D315A
MAELQFPDIVGQYRQGMQYGQQQQANKIAGQVYGADPTQRQPLLSQLAALNPQLAVGLGNDLTAQDAAKAQRDQALQDRRSKLASNTAEAMIAAYKSGDPARINGTYQGVRNTLASFDPANAANLPQQWTPDLLPTLYKVLGQTGGMAEQKGTVVAPGGVLVDSATGQQMFTNPAKPANMQLVEIPDGNGGSRKMLLDPASGKFSDPFPSGVPNASAPSSSPLDAINARASQLVNSGQMTPEQGDAWIRQQYANAGAQITPTGGGLGYSPPKNVRTLTPQEVKQYGLPEGTVAQVDPTGKIDVVSNPPQMSAAQEAIQAVKAQKATEAQQATVQGIDGSIQQIDQLLKAPGFENLGTFMGDTFGRIPHTDTANARALLDTIGNQSLLNTLSNLKSLSATGASGFGNLTDSEGRIIRNAQVNLGENQNNDQLRNNLIDYKNKLQRTRDRIAGAQIRFDQSAQGGGQSDSQQPAMSRPRAVNPQTGQAIEWNGQSWVPANG